MRAPSLRACSALSRIALAAAATCALPAHAQFGGLLQSMMQAQQQAAQQEAAQRAATPAKRWGTVKPVPADLRTQAQAFAAGAKSAEMRPLYERLFIEGERNATLNFERIGLAALSAGDLDTAEKAFEAAVARIDLIYADNPEAQKAKSLWTAEKVKDFKGEPYERAMAYFYRGIVWAAKGDFQNARAMFKQADYQDTVAEAEAYAGDFGLMPYMAGWASYCDGNEQLAKEFAQQAAKVDKGFVGISAEQPVLVLFETSRVPFKYGGGKYGELLKWQQYEAVLKEPKYEVQGACVPDADGCKPVPGKFIVGGDVGFQATTRGGRPIDAVLGGKASFREGAEGVANVATAVGAASLDVAMLSGNRDAAGLGMVGMFAGLVAQGMAENTQAQADIREWEQLQGQLWLGTGSTKLEAPAVRANVQTFTQFVGVGMSFERQGSTVKLVNVMAGAPAHRAGLRSGDELLAVDGAPVATLQPQDIAAKVRGNAGTAVNLRVVRNGEPQDVPVVRDTITNPVVPSAPLKRLVDAPRCQLYWGRAMPAAAATVREAGPLEPGEHPRDPAFRGEIQAMFGA
ncbi:PDZ domain-containing protein [Ramlibacter algicola]|uniref:PDZ domain-containing protein n=1 Tax=Ramlibacter algicola TaxID=2795217 RepID=A0A934Q3X3_9BURK|nr:PDZ domain-containing protein [Ramlibacter algicola]MBK0394082.1 PDZ domain-containing protein [Ramlibacter algicola]